MTYAVGIGESREYFQLPIGKAGGGKRPTVSTTPTTVTLDSDTNIVLIATDTVWVYVEFGDNPTVGTTDGSFRHVVPPGHAIHLATGGAAKMALVTDSGTETIVVEQY